MIKVESPLLIHEIKYRSSGATAPRDLVLEVCVVRYTSDRFTQTILATADLQGRETQASNRLLGELVADEIKILQEFGDLPIFDICALCGDFYDYPDLRKLGGTGDVTSAVNALSETASQTFLVLGNHDEINDQELDPTITVLDGNSVQSESITIGGVSGIIGNPSRNNRKTEENFISAIKKCSNSKTDILLLHQGPKGPTEAELGFSGLNEHLLKQRDLLVMFGHSHWQEPFYVESQNLLCNVDARVIAFLPSEEK